MAEGAAEAVYLAASNDIKKGRGVTITIQPPRADNQPRPERRGNFNGSGSSCRTNWRPSIKKPIGGPAPAKRILNAPALA
jgi:hypothetical protein